MGADNVNSKQHGYLIFWLWQYTIRSPNGSVYMSGMDHPPDSRFTEIHCYGPVDLATWAKRQSHYGTHCLVWEGSVGDFSIYFIDDEGEEKEQETLNALKDSINSDVILKKSESGSTDYWTPIFTAKEDGYDEDNVYFSIKPTDTEKGSKILTIDIDTNFDQDTIINEIREELVLHEWWEKYADTTIHDEKGEDQLRLEKLLDTFRQKRTRKFFKKIERVRVNDLPRAIGLWLWDYINKKKIPWKHRAKSYAAFRGQYQNPNKQELFIKAYFKDSQLAELLDATNTCIKKMEVLPMG
jgi:hypothetical protein